VEDRPKIGRPTKYDPEMCEKVVELYKLGYSNEEVGLELDICEDTFYRWLKEHKDFSEAVKKGLWYSKGYWMKDGRESLRDEKFSYTGWYMNMKNRFGWKDKTETVQEVNLNLSEEHKKADEIQKYYEEKYRREE